MVILTLWLSACKHEVPVAAPAPALQFADLSAGDTVAGFFTEGVYTDHQSIPRGGHFIHAASGFELRLVEQPSVPAAMVTVNTVPEDDKGVPHTQEHLLLGKGNVGRAIADLEAFQLVDSSAYTERMRTVYHFRIATGTDGFFEVFEKRMNALLNPDYTDEEVRREVYHFGVDGDPGALELVEKGTVYNEMTRSSQSKGRILWHRVELDLYGSDHPQSRNSGGDPDAMRSLTPAEIRSFHARTHALGNMDALVFLPPGDLEQSLARFDAVLTRLQPEPTPAGQTWPNRDDLPSARTVESRDTTTVRFPKREGKGTTSMMFGYPPRGARPDREDVLLGLFFTAVMGNSSSNLNKVLVDQETRERETGVKSVWGYQSDMPGAPILFGASDFPADTDDATIEWVKQRILDEFRIVAAWEPGDPDLADFNRRVDAMMVDQVRETRMTLAEPPAFGTRGTGSGWLEFLEDLDREGGFARSLALEEPLDWVRAELASGANPWADLIRREGWLDKEPLTWVARPDPMLLKANETSKAKRLADELERLKAAYDTADPQEALQRYQAAFDETTAALADKRVRAEGKLVDDAPMEPDPTLVSRELDVAGHPAVRSDFTNMTGARVHVVFDARAIPAEHLELLASFDDLLWDVGMTVDGEVLDDDAVSERLQREVRYAYGRFETNPRTGRFEYQLAGEGTDLAETRQALAWMRHAMTDSNWSEDNLPRLRSLVTASADRWLDSTPTGFISALRRQDDAVLLHATVGAVRQLDVLRLKWRLNDAGDDLERVAAAVRALGRDQTVAEGSHPLIDQAIQDMRRMTRDVPDATAEQDRLLLATWIEHELRTPPTVVLDELRAVREALFTPRSVRLVLTGGEILDALEPDLKALLAATNPAVETVEAAPGTALKRIAARGADVGSGHLAWLDPELPQANVNARAPFPMYEDIEADDLLDYLAVETLAGGGATSMFMATWGEGLAYSNGSSASASSGALTWSASRCPDVGQTVRFAASLVDATPVEETDTEYAMAGSFWSSSDKSPQSRGWAKSQRVVDGRDREPVRAFREALVAARTTPNLPAELARRRRAAYAPLFPSLGGADTVGADDTYTLIKGNQDQLDSWNAYLEASGHPASTVLYPRDFWELEPGAFTP